MPSFRGLIEQNKATSFWLMAGFCLFFILLAVILCLAFLIWQHPDRLSNADWMHAAVVGLVAGGISLGVSSLAFFSGDEFVLSAHGATPITHDDDPELFNVVEEMAIAAGTPMPRVYLIADDALNAFATGRDPEHASVAITTGLRNQLTRDELQGVLAHEMSHVRNYDIRLMLLAAVLVGSIVMLCDIFRRASWFGGGGGGNSRDGDRRDGGSNPLGIVIIVVAVILAIIAPILAQLIQLAISRQREYLADATAIQLTRYPQGLISALRKLRDGNTELITANRGTAHLFIANPVKRFAEWADSAFSSHPPLDDRIRRLEGLIQIPGMPTEKPAAE
jgi:heat shock protein HtpX